MPKTLSFLGAVDTAEYYGLTANCIRRWKAEGEAKGVPAPFERPDKLILWLRNTLLKKQIPQSLFAAQARWKTPSRGRTTVASKLEDMDAGGLQETLEGCRRMEAITRKRLEEAIRSDNQVDEEKYRGPYLKAVQQLHQVEKAVTYVEEKRGDLISRHAILIAWENAIGGLPRAMEKAMIAARPDTVPGDEWPKMVRVVLDKAFALLPTELPDIFSGAPAPVTEPQTNEQP